MNPSSATKTDAQQSYQILPWELIDQILISMGDAEVAVELARFSAAQEITGYGGVSWAVQRGKLSYLKYLKNKWDLSHFFINYDILIVAALNNHVQTLKFCHEFICPIDKVRESRWIMAKAAAGGHLLLVQYLHSIGVKCSIQVMNYAAKHGHIDIIKWLQLNTAEGCSTKAMDWAAENGHLGVIKWLHENRAEGCTSAAIDRASEYEHFEVLQWLHENPKAIGTSDEFE